MLPAKTKKKALTNPSSVFKQPEDVVACADSQGREGGDPEAVGTRRRLLQVATEEGMGEGEHSLFADVKKAQGKLHVPDLEEAGAPDKVGRASGVEIIARKWRGLSTAPPLIPQSVGQSPAAPRETCRVVCPFPGATSRALCRK